MFKAKGYTSGKLYGRINKAAKEHLITSDMKTWADEVRLESNAERHADEDYELPTVEDAERVLKFALSLAEYLFVLPSKVEQGRKPVEPESPES